MDDITVTIKGFKTQDAAYEFMNWYCGAGEQELDYWMECRRNEGKNIPNNFITTNIDNKTNTLTIN